MTPRRIRDTIRDIRDTIRDTEIGQGWHRLVIIAAVVALVTEGVLGTIAMIHDFGPELAAPFDHISTGAPAWVFAWEALQLLGAISLPFIAVLVLRGSRPGLFAALTLQLAAIVVSGYRMVDTLPDTFSLIGVIAITTVLLATKSVRDWCLGRSDPAFEHLIATPTAGREVKAHPATRYRRLRPTDARN